MQFNDEILLNWTDRVLNNSLVDGVSSTAGRIADTLINSDSDNDMVRAIGYETKGAVVAEETARKGVSIVHHSVDATRRGYQNIKRVRRVAEEAAEKSARATQRLIEMIQKLIQISAKTAHAAMVAAKAIVTAISQLSGATLAIIIGGGLIALCFVALTYVGFRNVYLRTEVRDHIGTECYSNQVHNILASRGYERLTDVYMATVTYSEWVREDKTDGDLMKMEYHLGRPMINDVSSVGEGAYYFCDIADRAQSLGVSEIAVLMQAVNMGIEFVDFYKANEASVASDSILVSVADAAERYQILFPEVETFDPVFAYNCDIVYSYDFFTAIGIIQARDFIIESDEVESGGGGSPVVSPSMSERDRNNIASISEWNDITTYAVQWIGCPYVWGGKTNIVEGTDCSGFVYQVYKHFGYVIPQGTSGQMSFGRDMGNRIENARPGDLIMYRGDTDHVGIYLGNNIIVHSSNSSAYPVGGVKTSPATYRTIATIRRILED